MKLYYQSKKNNFHAMGIFQNGVMTVLKGSKISDNVSKNFRSYAQILKLRNDGNLVDDNMILKKDISFNSLSTAANFVAGYSVNGKIYWKTEDCISYSNLCK